MLIFPHGGKIRSVDDISRVETSTRSVRAISTRTSRQNARTCRWNFGKIPELEQTTSRERGDLFG